MSNYKIHLVTMPKWGLAMQEGTIVGWHVAEGDRISEGQPLCDIETAKITNEFDSPFSGVLARVLKPGASLVTVGELIGVIADEGAPRQEIDERVAEMLATYTKAGEDADSGPQVQKLDTKEGTIAYVETGDPDSNRAVLFIHGFGGDHKNWSLLQSELPESMRAIALDLPGHGRSGTDVGTGSAKDIARAVSAFIAAIGLQQIDLVAHSFGASVAAAVAAANVSRVCSIFVIAPLAFGASADPAFVRGYVGAYRKREMIPVMEMLFSNPKFLNRAIISDALATLRNDEARLALTKIGEKLLEAKPGEAQQDMLFLQQWPSLVVWGDSDRVVAMPAGFDVLAGDALKIIHGAGHMPHAEDPSAIAKLLRAHLVRNDPSRNRIGIPEVL